MKVILEKFLASTCLTDGAIEILCLSQLRGRKVIVQ